MSDFKTFTETLRKHIRTSTISHRNLAILELKDKLDLVANEQVEPIEELGGLSAYQALDIIRNVGVDRIVNREVNIALNKMAGKLLKETLNET